MGMALPRLCGCALPFVSRRIPSIAVAFVTTASFTFARGQSLSFVGTVPKDQGDNVIGDGPLGLTVAGA